MADSSTVEILRREHARARALGNLYRLPMVLLGFGLPALAFSLFDLRWPVMEQTAFVFIMLSLGIGVSAAITFVKSIRQTASLKELAQHIEKDMPELMDALVCACELSEKGEPQDGPLHHALLERVNRIDRSKLTASARRNSPSAGRVFIAWVMTVLILTAGHFMPLGQKFRDHALDLVKGTSSGLTVEPGDAEVAEGDEQLITATVLRGSRESVAVEVIKSGSTHSYRMTETDSGDFEFTLYAVREPVQYRVKTPTLQSSVYTITPYLKPALESITLTVTPPEYTQAETVTTNELTFMSIQQGSKLTLTAKANMPLKAFLVNSDDDRLPFEKQADESHTLSMVVDHSDTYRIILEDTNGHMVQHGEPWDIEMIKDLPPVIKILEPEKETSRLTEGKDLPISAEITDDYGTKGVDIVYNINGSNWVHSSVRAADLPGLPLVLIANSLDLESKVKIGDVVLFYLEATDEAQPKPNVSRSGIRFVEIRPEPKPDDEDQSQGEGQGDKKDTLRVDDLIIRTKALIRDILSVSLLDDPKAQEEALQSLAGKAADLHLDTNRRYMDIKAKAEEKNLKLGDVGDWFIAAVESMKTGYKMLGQKLAMEAVSSEQAALSNLIKIAIELEKNAKKQQGKGQGKQSSQPKQSDQQKQSEQENAEKKQREAMEAAEQMLADLRELIREESQLRERMEELDGQDKTGRKQEESYVANKQQQVAERTEALRDRLAKQFPQGQDVGADLDRAKLQMQNAKRNVASSQPGTAGKYAGNAVNFLQRARSGMERLRDALANTRLRQAMGKLNALQTKQGQLQAATAQLGKQGEVDRAAAAQLSKNQQALEKEFDDLLAELDKAGSELETQTPGSEKRMQEAIRNAQDNRIGPNMKRAANSLRYRRPGKAGEYQGEVQAALKKLAADLEDIQRRQGQLSAEELSAMLEKTLKNMHDLKKTPPTERAEARKKAAQELKEMAARVGNKQMSQLSNEAQQLGQSGGDPSADTAMENVLANAANILERELLKAALREKIRLSRAKGQQAPDEYRKLVEQYFKALSEDAEE